MKAFLLCMTFCIPLMCYTQEQKARFPDVVLLNGTMDCTGRMLYADVTKLLGHPDSIRHNDTQCGNFFGTDDSIIYYHNAACEKNADTLNLKQVDFSSNKFFIRFGKVKLTASTTLEDLEEYYDPSYYAHMSSTDGYINGKKPTIVSLEAGSHTDEKWILWFCDDKLVRLELWVDC